MRTLTRRQRLAGLALSGLAVALIALDVTGSDLADAHGGAQGVLGSLYRGTDDIIGPARRFIQGIPDVPSNRTTIADLKRQNAALRQSLAQRAQQQSDSAQLQALNALAGVHHVRPARVIGFGPSGGFDWTVTLDAGSRDGVRIGQTVLNGDGLVGRVLRANASTSVVLLAADPGSGVGARDTGTGELGVASGRGSSGFTYRPLNPAARPLVGDELITGPNGASSYVAGLPIGTITAVRVSTDGSTTASVRAASSPTTLDVVGVITTSAVPTAPPNVAGPR